MTKKYLSISFWLTGLLGCATAQACGSTTCPVNTNWDEHGFSRPGWSADLRYSYSRAGTLRSGSDKIAADTGGDEVENLRTINRLVTASVDYTHDEHWGLALRLPYIMRDHNHNLGPYDAFGNPAGYESFTAKSLGDIKVVGRYRWALDEASHSGMGVKFGLKLNTGRKDFQWASGGVPGELALQPGNGSTDAILGAFWQQAAPGSAWSWFAQGIVQSAFSTTDQYRPGNQINLDGGARHALSQNLSGLLQLNVQWNGPDAGVNASPLNSGGSMLSLAPGLSYSITPGTQLYGLVQLPLHHHVNGEQLTANSSITVGIGHRF